MPRRFVFNRTATDEVTKEILDILAESDPIEFRPLFDLVYAGLKKRKAGSGTREVLSLRCYERLIKLVQAGVLEKKDKQYRLIERIEPGSNVQPGSVDDIKQSGREAA